MELIIFPAVFLKNVEKEGYVVAFDDIEVFCVGDTIEDAYKQAKHYLKTFAKLSYRMYGKIQEKPRTYLESVKAHPKQIVLLIDAEVKPTPKVDAGDDIFNA